MVATTLMGVVDRSSTTRYLLPFVGRTKELGSIVTFCRDVREENELAACWIHGEAGIGKSALAREAGKRLNGGEGIVLSVCLYPDSVESFIALLSDSLNANSGTFRLLKERVQHSLPSVLAALRRLARLRPLTLILEDLHLMKETACEELVALLHGLRNESIAVICLSRVDGGETYTRLFPQIRKNVDLTPLTPEEINELAMTAPLRDLHITGDMLYEASRGYPLILQAVLLELQNLNLNEDNPGRAREQHPSFISNRAALSIKGLTNAFLSGLSDEEKEMTRRLTVLGERFSRIAAEALLREKAGIVDRLLEKGLVVPSTAYALPLYGAYDSTLPLRFNHSLVFEKLLAEAVVAEEMIIGVFERNVPLYSLTLFQQLEKAVPGFIEPERVETVIRAITKTADALELRLSANRKLAVRLCGYAELLFHRHEKGFNPDQRKGMLLELTASVVHTLRQQVFTQEHLDKLEEFTRLTDSPESERTALYRCICLSNRLLHYRGNAVPDVLVETEELARRFPSLMRRDEFIRIVANLAWTCVSVHDETVLPRIQALFDRVLAVADPATQTTSLLFAGSQILFAACTMSGNREDLNNAMRFSHSVHSLLSPHYNEREALVADGIRAYTLLNAGCLSEAMKSFHHYRNAILHSRAADILYMKRSLLGIQASIGVPISLLESRYLDHLKETQEVVGDGSAEFPSSLPRLQWILGSEAILQGYMRGDLEWGEKLALRVANNSTESLETVMPMNRAASKGDRERLRSLIKTFDVRFGPLMRGAVGETDDPAEVIAAIRTFTVRGVINIPTLMEHQTILDLARMAQEANPSLQEKSELTDELVTATRQAIDWCIEKRVPGYAVPFLRIGASLLDSGEHARLSAEIEQLTDRMPMEIRLDELVRKEEGDNRITLSVIGTISTSQPSLRFQGGRVRRTVATMVVNQLLQRPLSLGEFRHIATGMASNSEKTASYTRTLLWRIRTLLGPDAIIADGESPPRFNTDHIRVDLIEASGYLDRCVRAVREARPRHAREALMSALTIIGEGPIYPTLFDEFFEAARFDFEIRLRDCVRSTVMLLRREGDLEEAERLLQTAQNMMPGDEELTEELVEVLQLLGRNAEAVALHRRSLRNVDEPDGKMPAHR